MADLWRFPVKSMGGERLAAAEVAERGIAGDRAYALVDAETGLVPSATDTRRYPRMLECHATFAAESAEDDPPPARITLPTGASGTTDSHQFLAELSAFFGRRVTLTHTPPEGYRRKQAEFFSGIGLDLSPAPGLLADLAPLSIITTSTLARLAAARPESRFDSRRFRMNIIVQTQDEGFVENDWVGRQLAIGDTLRVTVTMPDPRCAVTTLGQDDLPPDPAVLRTVVRENSLTVGRERSLPCAGVYAQVDTPGQIRIGDRVRIR